MASGYLWSLLKKAPVFVPAIYAFVAALWIFFSDRVLASMVGTPELLTELQTYKGWFFVAVTTALLALLIYWRQHALNELNASLEQRVLDRTAALATANENLQQLLIDLKHAQSELVRSEKLAALGALVAGIAHELNTPIGNCLMVASTFSEETAKLGQAFAAGGLKKSVFESYVAEGQQACELIVRNLGKASELVSSFKQVAVDRTSSKRREFALAEVVNEILATLRPGFKRLPISVQAIVPEGIRLDSYPGPLGQVLSNLIDNAIIHGLDRGSDGGWIEILARQATPEQIELIVRDNGNGIPAENLAHVFDPFFTTRFGLGGSGLGLHIVHHLVTQVLGGRVSVLSGAATVAGTGTEFVVLLPVRPHEVITGAA